MNLSNLSIKKVSRQNLGSSYQLYFIVPFQIHQQLKSKSITSSDVHKYFARRQESAHRINAYITETQTLASQQAKQGDNRYAAATPLSILDGISVAFKDNFCIQNVRTTCASRMLRDFVPAYNCTVYQRLAESGCTLMGKTNMDEFGMGSGTVDSIYGPTKNPWSESLDDWNITGGSSGGSAAAVASGSCTV